ncbi:hypothetical protein L5M28_01060 [Shewanella sp. SW32]|uniref:hypothetical protein n=1 Tax=unclassified Shewanella TaxID=196818 RepID=UPI0021D95305|nr:MULTISPECIES: hypothetical protein [unclassified Shewanella]MCU7961183.1 hypothetical protein [Shewanella sp. SW32]MCU7969265.1 hypothetical protein [Shewanella sp. SW29]
MEENIKTLLANHAYWADKKRELQEDTKHEFHSCDGVDTAGEGRDFHSFGKNCYQRAFELREEISSFHEPYSFDECFDEIEPCEHCVRHKELKKQLAQASRRLGNVRAAITKIGRKLQC